MKEAFYETIVRVQKVLFGLFNGYAESLFISMFKSDC
jgi:hypothetical protein